MIPGLAAIAKYPPWMLIGFGVMAGYLKSAWHFVYDHTIGYLVNRVTVTLSIEEVEHWDAYTWVSFWAEKRLRDRRVNSLLLQRRRSFDANEDDASGFGLIPHYGTYRALSIPYQHGVLFWGVAGSGKTTVVRAIASLLRLPVYSLSFNNDSSQSSVRSLLKRCTGPCILLLEDFDCIAAAQHRKNKKESSSLKQPDLNLADLLNLIDGIGAPDKRLIIMTTNHRDVIDPALLRSGRVDQQWEFTYSTDTELLRFYERAKDLFSLPDWELYRAALPDQCTISDAQALAVKGGW